MRLITMLFAAMFVLVACDKNDGTAERAGEAMDEAVDAVQDKAGEMGLADDAGDKAKDMAGDAEAKAKEMADDAEAKAKEMADDLKN